MWNQGRIDSRQRIVNCIKLFAEDMSEEEPKVRVYLLEKPILKS